MQLSAKIIGFCFKLRSWRPHPNPVWKIVDLPLSNRSMSDRERGFSVVTQLLHQKNFTPSSPISSAFRFNSNVFSDLTKTSISSPWKSEKYTKNVHLKTFRNKKAVQSNASRPLSDSLCFIVNKFGHVQGRVGVAGPGPCTATSHLNRQD